MRCGQVQRLSTAYLDGDLDNERSSAVRGHLRSCAECSRIFDDELEVRAAVGGLDDTLDPPEALWQRICDEVAEAEVRDAERSTVSLALRRLGAAVAPYRLHLAMATVASLIVAVLIIDARRPAVVADLEPPEMPREVAVTSVAPAVFSPQGSAPAAATHTEARIAEIRLADERYEKTIAELREIAAGDRPSWSASDADRYDHEVARFETRISELRRDLARRIADDPRRRDPLYEVYRQHIAFLEDAVWGEL